VKKFGFFLFAPLLFLSCGKVQINEKGKPTNPFNDGFENKSLSRYDLLLVSDSLITQPLFLLRLEAVILL
jgi:hypothetical protein